jgi:hypothetical protein
MNLSAPDTAAERAALGATNAAAQAAVLRAGGYAWNYMEQAALVPKSAGAAACTAWFRDDAPRLAGTALSAASAEEPDAPPVEIADAEAAVQPPSAVVADPAEA